MLAGGGGAGLSPFSPPGSAAVLFAGGGRVEVRCGGQGCWSMWYVMQEAQGLTIWVPGGGRLSQQAKWSTKPFPRSGLAALSSHSLSACPLLSLPHPMHTLGLPAGVCPGTPPSPHGMRVIIRVYVCIHVCARMHVYHVCVCEYEAFCTHCACVCMYVGV